MGICVLYIIYGIKIIPRASFDVHEFGSRNVRLGFTKIVFVFFVLISGSHCSVYLLRLADTGRLCVNILRNVIIIITCTRREIKSQHAIGMCICSFPPPHVRSQAP